MSGDQTPAPGKTKLIKFPPSRAGKDVKCPGYARGGCWRFDLTDTLLAAVAGKAVLNMLIPFAVAFSFSYARSQVRLLILLTWALVQLITYWSESCPSVPCYVYWTPTPFSSSFGGVRNLVLEDTSVDSSRVTDCLTGVRWLLETTEALAILRNMTQALRSAKIVFACFSSVFSRSAELCRLTAQART